MATKDFTLRKYQLEAIRAVQADWNDGLHNVLVTAAAGTGKTEIFSALVASELEVNADARVLVLCHRRELIWQARDRMALRFPQYSKSLGIVMAQENDVKKQIIYSSVQTLVEEKRLGQLLKHGAFTYVIRDEAHRAVTPTDRKLFTGLRKANPDLYHLGVTATPIRLDQKGLVEAYEKESYHYDISKAVKEGALVPPRWLAIQTGLSLEGVHSSNGDYSAKDLADVYDTANCFDLIVESHKKYADGRQAIAFTASVKGAYALADKFIEAGFRAAATDGSTNKADRAQRLADFRSGKLDVLCNCQLYTEGLDVPEVSCVHQARPTKSNAAYLQMIGRGMRTFPGKADCLILDYCPLDSRDVVMLGDVLGVADRHDIYMKKAKEPGEVMGGFTYDGRGVKFLVGDANELVSRELDYLDQNPWSWYRGEEGWMSVAIGQGPDEIDRILVIAPLEEEGQYAFYGVGNSAKTRRWTGKLVMSGSFEAVIARAEDTIGTYGQPTLAKKGKGWRKQPMSPNQKTYAMRLGVAVEPTDSKGILAQKITHFVALKAIAKEGGI